MKKIMMKMEKQIKKITEKIEKMSKMIEGVAFMLTMAFGTDNQKIKLFLSDFKNSFPDLIEITRNR